MKFSTQRSIRAERGAALIEYGLLVGLVSLVAITAVGALGLQVSHTFSASSEALDIAAVASEEGEGSSEAVDTGPDYSKREGTYSIIVGERGNYTGFMGSFSSGATGSIDQVTGSFTLMSLLGYEATAPGDFWFTVAGDQTAEMATMDRLDCGEHGSFAFADARRINFISSGSSSRTWVEWFGVGPIEATAGDILSCDLFYK